MIDVLPDLRALPGNEYVREGFADLHAGRESLPALLLQIARTRLREAGLPVPATSTPRDGSLPAPETRLYRLLCETHGDEAHSQYNAHLRRLDSLCRALEHQQTARARAAASGE